ncbi:MAG: sugar ABC transporter permease [Anaerolineae bacterium]|jgi:arabinogalactan oligomer/maltooligosaccharide transport system permease protein
MAVAEMSGSLPGQGKSGWERFWHRVRQSRTAWLYILPAGLIMFVITLIPQLYQVWMSFTDYRIKNLRYVMFDASTWEKYAPPFVGLENYVKILTNNLAIENYNFGRLVLFNVTWTVTNVIFHVALGIMIALALNYRTLIGKRIYRALFVLPWAIPGYITALTWRNMYDDRFGAFNQLLGVINEWIGTGFPTDTRWLDVTNPPIGGPLSFLPLSFYCVLLANVWLGWPFMMVVATGALQAIPEELYEAASIDGASAWQKLRTITLPLIRPAMVPAIMLGTIMTFNQFNVIYFISEGGPFGRTEILITQAFKLVYEQRLYGVAAAFSIVVFFVLLIITLIQNRVTRATEAYYA